MHRRTRRFLVWLAISIALHLLAVLLIPPVKPHETLTTVSSGPLTVELVPQQKAEVATAEQVAPEPRKAEAPPIVHRPIVAPRTIAREGPKPTVPLPPPVAPPPQPSPPPPKEPPVDMMASIASRRAQREAAEAALARGPHRPSEAELAQANIERNLRFDPNGGVGGVFQILSKGQLSAEFAFNGWEPDRDRKWREVIEVHVKPGEDIERGIVKRMMELIRGHYKEDFRWESRRKGRVVVLSARLEDTEGTEDFLMEEFFDTPVKRR
ncbi:MAG TPA: hypothetical protein VLL50_01745 [Usitatibacter sp.]|nr:hypothetical protein [Usitatibacter sp.]